MALKKKIKKISPLDFSPYVTVNRRSIFDSMNLSEAAADYWSRLQQDGSNFNVRHIRGDNIKLGLRAKRAGSGCSRLTWNRNLYL